MAGSTKPRTLTNFERIALEKSRRERRKYLLLYFLLMPFGLAFLGLFGFFVLNAFIPTPIVLIIIIMVGVLLTQGLIREFITVFMNSPFDLSFVIQLLKSRSDVDRATCDPELSNQRLQLARAIDSQELKQAPRRRQFYQHLSEAVYLNPWNRDALSFIGWDITYEKAPFSNDANSKEFLPIIAETLKEDGDTGGQAQFLFFYYRGKLIDALEKASSAKDFAQIQEQARNLANAGKQFISHRLFHILCEGEKEKEIAIYFLTHVAMAYSILEKHDMVSEMQQRADALDPGNLDIRETFGEIRSQLSGSAVRMSLQDNDARRAAARAELMGLAMKAGRAAKREIDDIRKM